MVITDKKVMYQELRKGSFGNATQSWDNWTDWYYYYFNELIHGERSRLLWGIRSLIPGGKFTPNVLSTNMITECKAYEQRCEPYNITLMMNERNRIFICNVVQLSIGECPSPTLDYVREPDYRLSWRENFLKYSKTTHGIVAWQMLRYYLDPSSFSDLEVLLDNYPGHVVELGAYSTHVGLIPHRNTVVWEVRNY